MPKITGPHPAGAGTFTAASTNTGWMCAHYTFADITGNNRWLGWKGSADTDLGRMFLERLTTAGAAQPLDASLAYDTTGIVPFQADSPLLYFSGLGQSMLVEMGMPKFGDTPTTKDFSMVGTFRRDGNPSAITSTKTFAHGTRMKLYWHRYADRHKISIRDLTNTAMPELIGYQIFWRPGGLSKEGG